VLGLLLRRKLPAFQTFSSCARPRKYISITYSDSRIVSPLELGRTVAVLGLDRVEVSLRGGIA